MPIKVTPIKILTIFEYIDRFFAAFLPTYDNVTWSVGDAHKCQR